MFISLETAEQLVKYNRSAFWDGWNIVIFNPKIDGFTKKNGMFRNNKWGVVTMISPGEKGYFVPKRYSTLLSNIRN